MCSSDLSIHLSYGGGPGGLRASAKGLPSAPALSRKFKMLRRHRAFVACQWPCLGKAGGYPADVCFRILCTLTIALALHCYAAAPLPWKLEWADEFDGSKLDFNKWAVEENAHGGGNNELQAFVDRPENVRIENGHLIIEARREPFTLAGQTRQFTSGRLRTKHRADWTYCRVEVQIGRAHV